MNLVIAIALLLVLVYALHRKGDVRASLKTFLFELSLDAKEPSNAREMSRVGTRSGTKTKRRLK